MKRTIKIDFADFWPTLVKTDNYIYKLLSRIYNVEISSNPEVLFFSCYGRKHLQYKCLKIFYCAENKRPDFNGCDYALTFDLINHHRHFRWPLYAHHIDFEDAWEKLTKFRTKEECQEILSRKKKFCCMVVSNSNAKDRIDFFYELSKYKQIESGGKYLNNIGGAISNKMDFIKDYKFVFSFENSSYPGYTTEKIIQPFIVNSIPIYWGNPKIDLDFNPKAFLDATKVKSSELIEQIINLDSNDSLAVEMLTEPAFNNNEIPVCSKEEKVIEFLFNAIESRFKIKKVSENSFKEQLHYIHLKKLSFKKKVSRIIRSK